MKFKITDLPLQYSKLTPSERREVRELYRNLQKDLCWFCGAVLTGAPAATVQEKEINLKLFPIGFLKNPIHLQHHHSTDLTEGAVHAKCNAVLWQYYGR